MWCIHIIKRSSMRSKTENKENWKHATKNNQEKVTFSLRFREYHSCMNKRQNVIELVHIAEPYRYIELHEEPQLLKLKWEFQSAAFYIQ